LGFGVDAEGQFSLGPSAAHLQPLARPIRPEFQMDLIQGLVGLVFALIGFVCWIIILIDAFKDEIWKGIVGLLCGLYLLYYALFEFEHDNKWLIVLLAIFGSGIGVGISRL
jgi:hypothetical protein